MEEGMLLIDKPTGITSFDVIRRLRRAYREGMNLPKAPKMGHAGTLDPLASGLMLIGVGAGTKKLKDYIKLPKEYVAEVLVGQKRSTGDMEGKVVAEKQVTTLPTNEVLQQVLNEMIGTLTLPVSAYSAIKKDGMPMYKRARKAEREGGVVSEVPIRDMEVMEAELLSVDREKHVVTVRFYVGSGTYIRSLAEDFGARIDYPATLASLRRTKVGEFRVEDARSI